jgi:hypothetical protein
MFKYLINVVSSPGLKTLITYSKPTAERKYRLCTFDIHMYVHRNIIPNYSQQNATFLDLFIFTDFLHVSGVSSIHHQEHITVHKASGVVNQYCC